MHQEIEIIGDLGKPPEMRYTPSGQPVTNISVATNRSWTDNKGERVKDTTWFRVTVWGKLAELVNQYLKKGSRVLVKGTMQKDPKTGGPRIWTGQDGQPRASFEINAQLVRFLDKRGVADAVQTEDAPLDDQAPPPDDDMLF